MILFAASYASQRISQPLTFSCSKGLFDTSATFQAEIVNSSFHSFQILGHKEIPSAFCSLLATACVSLSASSLIPTSFAAAYEASFCEGTQFNPKKVSPNLEGDLLSLLYATGPPPKTFFAFYRATSYLWKFPHYDFQFCLWGPF